MALRFLEMCGYECLDRRFRRQCGEIDLIVRHGEMVVFVEVKTRGQNSPAPPEAWVGKQKLFRMRQTARHWLAQCSLGGACHFRFDVVAVKFSGEGRGMELKHFVGVA